MGLKASNVALGLIDPCTGCGHVTGQTATTFSDGALQALRPLVQPKLRTLHALLCGLHPNGHARVVVDGHLCRGDGRLGAQFTSQVLSHQDRKQLSSRLVAAVYDIRNPNQVVI